MGKARTSGGGFIRAALLVLMLGALFAAGVGTAAASGNGKPESPPGQGECEHGNAGKPCRDDPQPTRGKDCEEHGNQGGVNEDHCGGVTPPPPPPTTTTVTPPPTTTTTPTTTVTTTTRSTPTTPSSPPPTTTTTTTQASPPSTPGQGPKQEEPKEEREPSAAPPKATPKADAPKQQAKHDAEPKQDVKGATAGAETTEPQCGAPRALAVSPETAGTLPFTGLPVWVFALAGLAALMVGIGLRRLARTRRTAAH